MGKSIINRGVPVVLLLLLLLLEKMHSASIVSLSNIASSYCSVSVKAIHDEIDPPSQTNAAIRYLKVAECAGWYTIGVFVFPPHVTMPIHDHPGMVRFYGILFLLSFAVLSTP
jgi:predicted metal-dependent enzyme (double-stranded beta helix superfamily)